MIEFNYGQPQSQYCPNCRIGKFRKHEILETHNGLHSVVELILFKCDKCGYEEQKYIHRYYSFEDLNEYD